MYRHRHTSVQFNASPTETGNPVAGGYAMHFMRIEGIAVTGYSHDMTPSSNGDEATDSERCHAANFRHLVNQISFQPIRANRADALYVRRGWAIRREASPLVMPLPRSQRAGMK